MLTAERLRELLHYDSDTGVFTWRVDRRGGRKAGDVTGARHGRGYVVIGIDNKLYLAHRLAWLWMTGAWPEDKIDHMDLDRANNRFANLRPATESQNKANAPLRRDNTSGFKGVSWHSAVNRWAAQIHHNKRHYHLGLFDRPEEAHDAYVAAAERLFGEYARAA